MYIYLYMLCGPFIGGFMEGMAIYGSKAVPARDGPPAPPLPTGPRTAGDLAGPL